MDERAAHVAAIERRSQVRQHYCSSCRTSHVASTRVAGKLAGLAVVAIGGARFTRSPAGVILIGALALIGGSLIDHFLEKHCPRCGAVLQVVGGLI